MATDILMLGPIVFDAWSTPQAMMFGGRQGAVVHKLPGGSRSVDLLGPDEADLRFEGSFYGNFANDTALILDGIRAAGLPVPLIFGGQFRLVIVIEAIPIIRRFPQLVSYSISCLVLQNPMQGLLSSAFSSVGDLVSSDMATAMSITGQ